MPDHPLPTRNDSATAFSLKAVITGVILALATVLIAWLNGEVVRQSTAIGSLLPPLPFGLILLLILVWNPLAGRCAALRFSTRELAVVFAFTLMVAWIPASGFMRWFQRSVVGVQVQADIYPQWRQYDTIGHLPEGIFPLGGAPEVAALAGAIAVERSALVEGSLTEPLAGAGVTAADYASALDLAELVPRKQWRDHDRALVRLNTHRAWQRASADDAERWRAAGELLARMPMALDAGAEAPPAWRLAQQRLHAGFLQRLGPATAAYEQVYPGMVQGLPVGDQAVPLAQVPLASWVPALLRWLPLVLLLVVGTTMLQLIVHRQWAHHEQLAFPLAHIAHTTIAIRPGSFISDIFRERLFWFAAIPVITIHLLNYTAAWWPGWFPQVPLRWSNLETLYHLVPSISQSGGISSLRFGAIYFAVIGLAYFISTEVSFSMGVAGLAVVLFNVQWYAATGTTSDISSIRMGAYVGYAIILLYAGRTYYWAVARRACGLAGGAQGEHAEAAWAARLLLLAFTGFTVMLSCAFALDWLVALAYGLTLMLLLLVVSRVVCETGMPFLQSTWQPASLLTNVLGIGAIGAAPLVMISYLSGILANDTSEASMPFTANAVKMADDAGVRRTRLVTIGLAVVAFALVFGVFSSLYTMYQTGASNDTWALGLGSRRLNDATREISDLVETQQYGSSVAASGLEKIPLMAEGSGSGTSRGWLTFGMLAVVSIALLRFRWPGFYLHPVLFLVWDTWPLWWVWTSFLIGWMAKEAVIRIGGGRSYQALKPLFIGLILGELAAAIITMGIGWLYHLCTGLMPVSTPIFSI